MTLSVELVEQVRQRAGFACEYCGVTETDVGTVRDNVGRSFYSEPFAAQSFSIGGPSSSPAISDTSIVK